jgi:hypothetical protein
MSRTIIFILPLYVHFMKFAERMQKYCPYHDNRIVVVNKQNVFGDVSTPVLVSHAGMTDFIPPYKDIRVKLRIKRWELEI